MKKPAILLLSFLSLFTITWAQNLTTNKTTISGPTAGVVNTSPTDLPFFSSSADAEKIVSGVMDAMGLESKFKIKVANVPNVEATIQHHERYILYNPDFVNSVNEATKDKWASIFILAHEVAHHLEGHTEAGPRRSPAIELEADQLAGFVLCRMGATLHQAQIAMYYISNMAASKTHPGRLDRLAAIETGWNKAQMQKEPGLVAVQSRDNTALTN